MTPAIHNERLKLSASFLSTVSSATITAGVIAPLAAGTFGLTTAPFGLGLIETVLGLMVWLSVGIALHFVARWLLTRMVPT